MDDFSTAEERKRPSGIQLTKGEGDTLEAVLGTGNNVLLKMRMSLKTLQARSDKEQVEIPAQLFLTDFKSSTTTHSPVGIKIKVDYELTPAILSFPKKPQSFKSYNNFTTWLNQGYFTNERRITYDFYIDPLVSAPSLAQQLYALAPGGYHFIGTHVIYSAKLSPDSSSPKAVYCSQRGNTNSTTVTLGGILYLNKTSYPVDDHKEIFSHPMLEEKVCKKDHTKKLYHHQWLAQSEITTMVTYKEFPDNKFKDWPNAPSGHYTVMQKKPGDLEEIQHFACWDGSNGEEVDISNHEPFLIDCGTLDGEDSKKQRSIVKDSDGRLYTVQYLNLKLVRTEEVQRKKELEAAQKEKALAERAVSPEMNLLRAEIKIALENFDEAGMNISSWNRPDMQKYAQCYTAISHWNSKRRESAQTAKKAMDKLYEETGERHIRINEMSGRY